MLEQELPEIQFSGTQNQPKNELKASFKILTHFNNKDRKIVKYWKNCRYLVTPDLNPFPPISLIPNPNLRAHAQFATNME